MFCQILLAHPRLAIKTMERSLGSNPHQVAVPFFVFCQHEQMVIVITLRIISMVFLFADVKLTAQNRLYTALLGRFKKMYRPVDIPVVGNRDCLLANISDAVDEFFHITSAVQKRVIRMQMQVGKFSHEYGSILVPSGLTIGRSKGAKRGIDEEKQGRNSSVYTPGKEKRQA